MPGSTHQISPSVVKLQCRAHDPAVVAESSGQTARLRPVAVKTECFGSTPEVSQRRLLGPSAPEFSCFFLELSAGSSPTPLLVLCVVSQPPKPQKCQINKPNTKPTEREKAIAPERIKIISGESNVILREEREY